MLSRAKGLLSAIVANGTTLRGRLMIWNAALIVVTALACFLGVREGVRRTLLAQMDDVLSDDADEIGLTLADLHESLLVPRPRKEVPRKSGANVLEALNRKAIGHRHNGWFVELADDWGRRLWASDQTPELPPVQAADELPLVRAGCRVIERRQRTAAGQILRIRVGAPMDFINRDIENIDDLAGWGVAIVLVVAPLAGYWLAGRSIRPLTQIIQTTARLRPNRLDERLPPLNTGDELDKLSKTVNQFLDRIAAYLAQSNDFLANSAHELRTPLAAIRSSVEVALGGNRTPNEYQELLAEVIEECDALERLVTQLLLLAESDSERLQARSAPLALSELVGRCVEMFSAVAEARQITLTSSIEPQIEVLGVAHHLRQLVNNLLDNALKFTPPQGSVVVSAERSRASRAVIRIRDTGCGIAPADLPHIFERFFRGHKTQQPTDHPTGTGLGLSICQAIVTAHGGEIQVDSGEGVGTTMTVHLPALPQQQSPVRREGSPVPTSVPH